MSRQVLDRGQFEGDRGPGVDSAWTATPKINGNFEELYAGVPHTRLDISTANLTASFRDDGAGNLGWYIGATGAADGAQIKAFSINKTTGEVQGSSAPLSGNNPALSLKNPGSGQTLNFGIWYGGAANGWIDAGAGSPLLLNPTGNSVGIGVPASSGVISKLTVQGSGTTFVSVVDTAVGRSAYFGYGGSYGYIGATGASNFTIQTNSTDRYLFSVAAIQPAADNTQTLGVPSSRWSVVYAGTGTINTSDAQEKTDVRSFSAAEIAAARDLVSEIGVFQWLSSIAEKGIDGARLHVGMTVQRAVEIMESHGLDPWHYGFVCRDEITRKVKVAQAAIKQATDEAEETYPEIEVRDGVPVRIWKTRIVQQPKVVMVAVVDEDGQPVQLDGKPMLHPVPVMEEREVEVDIDQPAGERLGFRYDQLTLFILRGLLSRVEAEGT